jgi:hypothetical protein
MLSSLINILITILFIPPVLLFMFYWLIGLNLALTGFQEKESFKIRSGLLTFLVTTILLYGSWLLWRILLVSGL